MTPSTLLSVMSLLSVVVMSLHITDDIVRGISPAAPDNVGAVAIFVVWLFGTLILSERRWGYAIQFLGGLFAAGTALAASLIASLPLLTPMTQSRAIGLAFPILGLIGLVSLVYFRSLGDDAGANLSGRGRHAEDD